VTFWENKADEKASLANIPYLVLGMSHVLASGEIYQDTFELVQDQHRIERSGEAAPPNRSTTCRTRAATIHKLPRRQRGSTLKGRHNKLFKRMREAPLYVIITLLCISPLGEAEGRRKPYTCLLTSPYLTGPIKESGT
jgi:hypothetical protein